MGKSGIEIVGMIPETVMSSYKTMRQILEPNGIVTIINTCAGGNLEPKIICGEKRRERKMDCDKVWDIPREQLKTIEQCRRVYSQKTIATTICAQGGDDAKTMKITEGKEMEELTIRKLTERECYRLMGFERKDSEACLAAGQRKANLYHQAGDSIVVTCLMGIFGSLMGMGDEEIRERIQSHADKLAEETR